MDRQEIIDEIIKERERALSQIGQDFDNSNTKNDWISYVVAYLGRASDKVFGGVLISREADK